MARHSLAGLDKKRLRRWVMVFFLALAIPATVLIYQAYSQLKWEAFHQNRLLAEELATRIDSRLIQLVYQEETRSFSDYSFLVVTGDPAANFVQRSPLSIYPVGDSIPGLIGYFQVDAAGAFTTPLLPQTGAVPARYGISSQQARQRLALQQQIQQILSENRLVHSVKGSASAITSSDALQQRRLSKVENESGAVSPVTRDSSPAFSGLSSRSLSAEPAPAMEEQVQSQAAFDRLKSIDVDKDSGKQKKQELKSSLGRVEDLKLGQRFQSEQLRDNQRQIVAQNAPLLEKRKARKERSALPEADINSQGQAPAPPSTVRVRTFESEIDPFEFSLLGSGHFVLYRKVWRDGQRYIQGAVIDQQVFLRGMIEAAFREAAIAQVSNLIVAYQGNVVAAFNGSAPRDFFPRASELKGQLLYQSRLSTPLSDMELIFSVTQLPAGPAGAIVNWTAAILLLVLCGGFYLMYRLGERQIELGRQQQDFVSAVSHELKTPLTSIRMYGEMLREGWATEDKKKAYYEYIYNESERLSRLINNVLQLARMTRNEVRASLKPASCGELIDLIRSKVTTQVEQAGFALKLDCRGAVAGKTVTVDEDYFTQIIINLVDNAVKFSAKANKKAIDVSCRMERNKVVFAVRDYGPGIGKDQMKKIFKLFYRSENELTRETVGTGIGLALVHQLAHAMQAQVDVVNSEPGAEFRLSLSA